MTHTRWHILDDGATLMLARQLPPCFDVAAETRLPATPRRRLAREVRQDLWRRLRRVRGFSPVIRIVRGADGLTLTAGGRIAARPYPKARIEAEIAALLADPAHRSRWTRADRGARHV